MSMTEVNICQLTLAHPANDLQLSVTASGLFKLSPSLSLLDENELREALVSGRVWIPRGRTCLVIVRISFNGKPLSESSRLRVLESLGYQCRDAHVSGQRSVENLADVTSCGLSYLSPALSIPPNITPSPRAASLYCSRIQAFLLVSSLYFKVGSWIAWMLTPPMLLVLLHCSN